MNILKKTLKNIEQLALLSKVILNNRFVASFASHKNIIDILEIGSGNRSTPLIRSRLKNKGYGFCTSLENNKDYYLSVSSKNPEDNFGKVVFSDLLLDKNLLKYDFNINKTYDFIYIDGPGNGIVKDPSTGEYYKAGGELKKGLQNPKIWLSSSVGGGSGRCGIFGYIKPAIKKGSIVMVDSSKSAMYYYYQMYRNEFDFVSFGGKTKKPDFYVKPQYSGKIKYRPGTVNIIFRKNDKVAMEIIKDVLSVVMHNNARFSIKYLLNK